MGNAINFLMTKHRKLEESEVNSLLKKYNLVDISKLPKIKIKDAGISTLEANIGDVIEILRNSFAGETKYYRVVIE